MTPNGVQMLDSAALPAEARLRRVDCDVHHALPNLDALKPFLATRWWDHLQSYGLRMPVPFSASAPFPKATPALSRTDSWPPDGGPPGSDLAFMQEQLLDRYDIQHGLLHLLYPCGMDQRKPGVRCGAVPGDQRVGGRGLDRPGATAESGDLAAGRGRCERRRRDRILGGPTPASRKWRWRRTRSSRLGAGAIGRSTRRRSPTVIRSGCTLQGIMANPLHPAGWPSFYVEEQHGTAISQQGVAISLVTEGVFARLPALRVVVVEAGFAWVPSVAWRLDRHWEKLRDEVPHLTRPPSEYMRENLWFTTQPMDEPERARDLRHVLDWIGWDRVLFASDYPHWDMDSPELGIKLRMSSQERRMIYGDNARAVYGLA